MISNAILMIFCIGVATITYLSMAVAVLLARDMFPRKKMGER